MQKLFNKCKGLSYPQDYLCLALETFPQILHLYLVEEGRVLKEITALHAFVGYCPVVFALPALDEIKNKPLIETVFSPERLAAGEKYQRREVVALLVLKRLATPHTKTQALLLFEALYGKHRFLPALQQSAGQVYNRLYNRKPGNVFLPGNLFKQVQIAYSLPRKICLITVGENHQYNLFPTDLHGQVTNEQYIVSLRYIGKACEQVLTTKQLVLSEMKATAYQQVYKLGKNHMQPFKDAAAFAFSSELSKQLRLPLPEGFVSYKELQLEDSFAAGIHRLLLFKIIREEKAQTPPETLVHIHNVYATWRQKKALPGNYLLR